MSFCWSITSFLIAYSAGNRRNCRAYSDIIAHDLQQCARVDMRACVCEYVCVWEGGVLVCMG